MKRTKITTPTEAQQRPGFCWGQQTGDTDLNLKPLVLKLDQCSSLGEDWLWTPRTHGPDNPVTQIAGAAPDLICTRGLL